MMKIDLLLINANTYNVFLRKWLLRDVAVLAGKILYVGDSSDKGFKPSLRVDCEGRPLIPGMIDIHLHIESSYCSPFQFSRAVLNRGVTTVVSEPHEMANVFGKTGIEEMIRLSTGCDADIFYGVPSSVPSTDKMIETTGGTITPQDGSDLFDRFPEIICVGEVMTYSSLLKGDVSKTREFLGALKKKNLLPAVEGHCPRIVGLDLARVMYEGIDSDHCLQEADGMRQRFEQGMFVELQYKSLNKEIINVLKEGHFTGLYSFVSDDVAPDILVRQGHLDGIVRKALALGLSLEEAVTASSFAPAKRIGFRDRGAISPGMKADFILLKDKNRNFEMLKIFKNGKEWIKDSHKNQNISFEKRFKKSIHLDPSTLPDEMFVLRTSLELSRIKVRTIDKNEIDTYTREGILELPVRDGKVEWMNKECNLILVIDRYTGKGVYSRGILKGSFFKGGAMATSHAHDSHNLLMAGDNPLDLKIARDWVIHHQGGICVCSKGEVLASLALPVGGILSEKPLEELSEKMILISDSMRSLGFLNPNPLMSFSTLTLAVSPEIKITDKGIIRTEDGKKLSLFL